MSADLNLLLIAGAISGFLVYMRTNAGFSFFGLAAGYLLANKVVPDLGSSFQTPTARILILLAPFAFLGWLYKKSQKTIIKLAMQTPAILASSVLGTLLIVEFMPLETRLQLQSSSTWQALSESDHYVYLTTILAALLTLFVVKNRPPERLLRKRRWRLVEIHRAKARSTKLRPALIPAHPPYVIKVLCRCDARMGVKHGLSTKLRG